LRFFENTDEFEVMLSQAIQNAHTAWEKRFVNDFHDRYLRFGTGLHIDKNAADKIKELQVGYFDRKVEARK